MSEAGPPCPPCPLCQGSALELLLTRPRSAVLQNRTFDTKAKARAAACGRLSIMRCKDCGFIHNSAFDPAIVGYTEEYENEQGNSPRFAAHMAGVAGLVRSAITGGAPLSIIDIGCGQGGFLALLAGELRELNALGFGFDTAYRGPAEIAGVVSYFRKYFDRLTAPLIPGGEVILITRHVIEHVPGPVQFLAGIRNAIQQDWRARLFVETPCVEWIFRNHAVQDFFYEHCNYWTAETLEMAARCAGFSVASMRHVFDGQYLWMEAVPVGAGVPPPRKANQPALARTSAPEYLAHEKQTIGAWRACAMLAAGKGPVALWGAGAKGVTMAALIDPDCRLIDCLIDINAQKQNRYIPVTAHQVVSPDTAWRRGVRTALVMNRNYLAEISDMLTARKIDMHLIDETMVRG